MNNYPFLNYDADLSPGNMSFLRRFPKDTIHQHSFYELIYVTQGTTTRKMADADVSLRAGDYYFIPPFLAHGYADSQNFAIASCLFREDDINKTFLGASTIASLLTDQPEQSGETADKPIYNLIFHDFDGTVRQIIRKIEQEHASCQIHYLEMIRFYLSQILLHAARSSHTRTPHGAVAQVAEFIKVHYAEPISLAALSQLVGYAPPYLSNLFSQEMGMSIKNFLQQVRIEEACKFLAYSDEPVTEIAAAVGYPNLQHFSKIFRQYQSISPREYRKQHKH